MRRFVFLPILLFLIIFNNCAQETDMKTNQIYFRPLTIDEEKVIVNKGTERPFTGEYDHFFEEGIYVCKQCGEELYRSEDKFNSGCGWPSFDDEIKGAVKRTTDADGRRTEITCNNCRAHLGHVFLNEGLTDKNTRHCVNSVSMEFIPQKTTLKDGRDIAYFAGGCFWGVEYYLQKAEGVVSVESGYMGGRTENPSYKDVCNHTTGHAEVVKVVFEPDKISFKDLTKLFFEIHDPTQLNHQGPDVGDQYRSEIFYRSVEQKEISEGLISVLKDKGFNVVTRVTPVADFWKAEEYHQDYYDHKGTTPYCHKRVERF